MSKININLYDCHLINSYLLNIIHKEKPVNISYPYAQEDHNINYIVYL